MSNSSSPLDLPGLEEPALPSARAPSPVDWLRLVVGAARRRPVVFAAVFALVIGLSAAYYLLRTPVYQVETRILAQRQQAVPSMIRTSGGDEAPTRTAAEFVHRRENLLAIIRETGLKPDTKGDAKGDDDPMSTLVTRLDRALKVTTGDGVITISIDWDDPQQAYHLVEASLQNFLEARQVQEITAFDEAISLMQGRVAVLRQQLDKEEARDASATTVVDVPLAAGATAPAPRPVVAVSPQVTEELARLKSLLDAKERQVRDMEEGRRKKLSELQAQLEERRGVYSDAHPNVIAVRKEIESFNVESQQLVALREEEARIREDYNAKAASVPSARPLVGAAPRVPMPVTRSVRGPESERVREARAQYQNMLQRVNEAQLALDTARAGFKYRYTVIRPAEVPRTPIAPRPLKVFGAGGLIALVLAFLAAAFPDLRTGRIVERWQVERSLDVPVLAEMQVRRR